MTPADAYNKAMEALNNARLKYQDQIELIENLKKENQAILTMLSQVIGDRQLLELKLQDTQRLLDEALSALGADIQRAEETAKIGQGTANQAHQLANTAQGTANQAHQLANTAQGTANQAHQLANTAQGTANQAVNLANSAINWVYSEEFNLEVRGNGQPHKRRMWHSHNCFALITSVAGCFAGSGERFWLEIGGDGHWYLCGHSLQGTHYLRAICVRK